MSIFHRKVVDSAVYIRPLISILPAPAYGSHFQCLEAALFDTCKKIPFFELPCFLLTPFIHIHDMIVCGEYVDQLSGGLLYLYMEHRFRGCFSLEPVSDLIVDPLLLPFIP